MGMSELGLDTAPGMLGAVPSSFATQMALATGGLKGFGGRDAAKGEDTEGMMGRLMLARMKTLEEGFAEVVREFRGMRTAGNSSVENESLAIKDKGKDKERERKLGHRKKGNEKGMPRTRSEVDFSKVGMGLDDAKGKGKENVGLEFEKEGHKDTPEGEILGRYVSKGSSL
jgi:hypothetical protein